MIAEGIQFKAGKLSQLHVLHSLKVPFSSVCLRVLKPRVGSQGKSAMIVSNVCCEQRGPSHSIKSMIALLHSLTASVKDEKMKAQITLKLVLMSSR